MTWFPSRHPDLDRDFYERKRPWPHGDRLFVKRFGDGKSETGYITPPQGGPETTFDLYAQSTFVCGGLTAQDLLDDRCEVD